MKKLTALKRYIAKRGDTQDDLAHALGMHRTTFNYKLNERNGKAFTTQEMEDICAHYNVPPEQRGPLFFGT